MVPVSRGTRDLRSPLTRKLREILADGRWHSIEALVDSVSGLIDPGAASRRASRYVADARERDGTEAPMPSGGDLARLGSRRAINFALKTLRGGHYVLEYDGWAKTRRVRAVK